MYVEWLKPESVCSALSSQGFLKKMSCLLLWSTAQVCFTVVHNFRIENQLQSSVIFCASTPERPLKKIHSLKHTSNTYYDSAQSKCWHKGPQPLSGLSRSCIESWIIETVSPHKHTQTIYVHIDLNQLKGEVILQLFPQIDSPLLILPLVAVCSHLIFWLG